MKGQVVLFSLLLVLSSHAESVDQWEIVSVPGVCTFRLPPTLEVQGGIYKEINDDSQGNISELRKGFVTDSNIVKAQPKGINAMNLKAMGSYCRFMIETIETGPGWPSLSDPLTFSSGELSALDAMYKEQERSEIGGSLSADNENKRFNADIIQWYPLKVSNINGVDCLEFGYLRTSVVQGKNVHVTYYQFLNKDRMYEVTQSYRMDEKDQWQKILGQMLETIVWNGLSGQEKALPVNVSSEKTSADVESPKGFEPRPSANDPLEEKPASGSFDAKHVLSVLLKTAESGDSDAQYMLGKCYWSGEAVLQDYEEALKWFHLAAEQGNPDAQLELGVLYYLGSGIPVNYTKAVKWLELAAKHGDQNAQFFLGQCYQGGSGVAQSDEYALKLFRLAAQQGHPLAALTLAIAYYDGVVVKQDYIEAYAWANIAATQGMGLANKLRSECLSKMSAGQIAKGQELSRQYAEKFSKPKE